MPSRYHTQPKPKEPELKDEPDTTYKTPTERGMENLRKQLENPRKIDLDKTNGVKPEEDELTDLRNRLGDTSDRINIGDLNNRLRGTQEPETEDDSLYRTDTERGMEELRNKIANASKIDLSKIPTK